MRRLVATVIVVVCGYSGGAFLHADRPDLAICTWLIAAFIAAAWILGDVPAEERYIHVPRALARVVCFLYGHYAPTTRPGWSWQTCRMCRRPVCVFRRPA